VYQVETKIPKEFNVTGIPVTFLISRDRKIALKHVGGADWSHEKVISYINELIDQKSELSALGFKGSLLRPPGYAGQAEFSTATGRRSSQFNRKRNYSNS
jgi:hypothetical protein